MVWARLDDRFPAHKKVRPLTDAAFRLHVSALCWTAENLTDGRIPTERLRYVSDVRQPKKGTAELVAADLWHEIPGGWLINDWNEYNPSRDEVVSKRKAEAEKKRRQRRANLGMSLGDTAESPPGTCDDVPQGLPEGPDTRGPARVGPVPSRPVVSGSLRDGPQSVDAHENPDHQEFETQAREQLAITVCQLQPSWQLGKVHDVIGKARQQAGIQRVTTALLIVAVAHDSQSPRRVLSPGYWWDENDTRYAEALNDPKLTKVLEAAS